MSINIFVYKRKARREHQCKTCKCVIKLGQEYYESRIDHCYGYVTWHTCKDCWQRMGLEA